MPTNEQLYSLRELRPQDWDDAGVTAIDMDAATGAKKTLTINFPCAPMYFGFRPVIPFVYQTQTTEGVLALYLYPGGDAAKKVLLAEIPLEDKAAAHEQYMVKVPNFPNSISQGHAGSPPANCVVQDQLVAYIKTQAVGSTYLAGTFQPILLIQMRGESYAQQAAWNDRTPAGTGILSTI